jgi:hypothetical protein
VQLIEAESGNHLWAERFDKSIADLFEMQDEIVARRANHLDVATTSAEARRVERAPPPDSIDLYFQGLAAFDQDNIAQAHDFFERALTLDPLNIDTLRRGVHGCGACFIQSGRRWAASTTHALFWMANARGSWRNGAITSCLFGTTTFSAKWTACGKRSCKRLSSSADPPHPPLPAGERGNKGHKKRARVRASLGQGDRRRVGRRASGV